MEDPIEEEYQSESLPPVETIDLDRMSSAATTALELATGTALEQGDRYVGTEHLLIGLFDSEFGAAHHVFDELGVDRQRLCESMSFITGEHASRNGETDPVEHSPRLQRVLTEAARNATARSEKEIGTLNLLSALLREKAGLAVFILQSPGVGLERVGRAISRIRHDGIVDA